MKKLFLLLAAVGMIFTACEMGDNIDDGHIEDYGGIDEVVDIPDDKTSAISFVDENAKLICVKYWDANQDGELSYEEAENVTSLGYAFKDSEEVENVENDNLALFSELKYFTNLTNIEDESFKGCYNLKKVTLPENTMRIGASAFDGCSKLRIVAIGHSLLPDTNSTRANRSISDEESIIGEEAFLGCKDLMAIAIPTSITSIGDYAFYDCESLASVTITDNVKYIGRWAFGWTALTNVTIPDSVTDIGEGAFMSCMKLSTFEGKFATNNGRALVVDGVLNSIAPAGLTEYSIPSDVTTVGEFAFINLEKLTNITIPDGVTKIGEGAFQGCSSLKSITIPDSTTLIGVGAFGECKKLENIKLGNSVTTIENEALWRCSSLKNITIPESVVSIEGAFSECNAMEAFYGRFASKDHRCLISDGVLEAFAPAGLTEYTIPQEVKVLRDEVFASCGLEQIVLPESVENIYEMAFVDCTKLKTITIPAKVTAIGRAAFGGCVNLKNFYCKPATPPSCTDMGSDIFAGSPLPNNIKFYVPFDSFHIYRSKWSEYGRENFIAYDFEKGEIVDESKVPLVHNKIYYTTTDDTMLGIHSEEYYFGAKILSHTYEDGQGVITFELPVTYIGDDAFKNKENLKNIIIPELVSKIGNYAFYNCSSLADITIPDSVTSIGSYAFRGCTSLTSITIPDSVTSIGECAFYNCTGELIINCNIPSASSSQNGALYRSKFTKVTIGDSVTSIGSYAFRGCSSLTSVTIPNSVTSIGEGAFCDCRGLTSITIPDSVTSIEDSAFSGCTSLTSVTIGDSVTSIGEYAFYNCISLTSVTIGNSVTSIGGWAFLYCTSLTSVTIGNSVTSIGGWAFSDCTSLATIAIPDSVTSFGQQAFYNCTSLTSVTIPDSVTSIGLGTFYNCTSLKEVYCKPTTPPTVNSDMFGNNASGRKIYVPTESVDAYKSAQYWSDYASYIEGYDF